MVNKPSRGSTRGGASAHVAVATRLRGLRNEKRYSDRGGAVASYRNANRRGRGAPNSSLAVGARETPASERRMSDDSFPSANKESPAHRFCGPTRTLSSAPVARRTGSAASCVLSPGSWGRCADVLASAMPTATAAVQSSAANHETRRARAERAAIIRRSIPRPRRPDGRLSGRRTCTVVVLMAAKRPEDLLLCHVCVYRRSQEQVLRSLRSHQDDNGGSRSSARCARIRMTPVEAGPPLAALASG